MKDINAVPSYANESTDDKLRYALPVNFDPEDVGFNAFRLRTVSGYNLHPLSQVLPQQPT